MVSILPELAVPQASEIVLVHRLLVVGVAATAATAATAAPAALAAPATSSSFVCRLRLAGHGQSRHHTGQLFHLIRNRLHKGDGGRH